MPRTKLQKKVDAEKVTETKPMDANKVDRGMAVVTKFQGEVEKTVTVPLWHYLTVLRRQGWKLKEYNADTYSLTKMCDRYEISYPPMPSAGALIEAIEARF